MAKSVSEHYEVKADTLATVRFGDPYDWVDRRPVYELVKRLLDVVIAVAALTLLSPVWLMVALIIKLSSPGSAIFGGRVVGKRGRPFTWYKFRTMVDGDDSHHREWLREFVTADKPYRANIFKVTPDPRVTPVGRWLRRLSLDEVPQFWNVLRGEMSVVGPRPPVVAEFQLYDDSHKRRLSVRPGITGLHQVTQRSLAPFSSMVSVDLLYIDKRSITVDLMIMWQTLGVMLGGRGAA